MTSTSIAGRTPIQAYARWAGVLFIISLTAGGFGEGYAPGLLIERGDAAATAANMKSNELIHRLSFAAYLLEALSDIAIAVIFYVILKPVSRGFALVSAAFGVVSMTLYAACEIFYFALPRILANEEMRAALGAFTPAQLDALTLLSTRLFNVGAGLFLIFYGSAWIIRGALIIRSGFLPAAFGWIAIIGGIGFTARTLTSVLAPALSYPWLVFLMFPTLILLGGWLLVKGVNEERWRARAGEA